MRRVPAQIATVFKLTEKSHQRIEKTYFILIIASIMLQIPSFLQHECWQTDTRMMMVERQGGWELAIDKDQIFPQN
jgi:hypothetical protein